MAGKQILVLGGGMGGVVAANRLRRLLNREHRVILIDRTVWHSLPFTYPWLMLNWRKTSRVTRDLRSLSRKGIEFKVAEITRLDFANKRVELGEERLDYDYLVVALGVEYGTGGIEGLGSAWTYYTLEGAEGLQEELPRFREGRIAIAVGGTPYRAPGAPYEGALLLDYYFARQKLRQKIEIRVITPEEQPLAFAGPVISEKIVGLLANRDIILSSRMQIKSVDQGHKRLNFNDGSEVAFDLLIATPVQAAPRVVRESGLTDRGQWVPVDSETLETEVEDVYAVGDVCSLPMANGHPLPKIGSLAHSQAEVAARNIAAALNGDHRQWAFSGHGTLFLENGYNKAAYISGDFLAEPAPLLTLRPPGVIWHLAKLGLEKQWLWRWF